MKCDLSEKHCTPCEGGIAPLNENEAKNMIQKVLGWTLIDDATAIHREFKFKGFNKTMGFVNAVAWIANQEGHHPDMEVGYNYCHITFTTHAIKGLSENDFICASKVNDLL